MKRALISVSDKTGVAAFAKGLEEAGFTVISTGGTLAALNAAGIGAVPVESVTGFPECLDGRVKTLHPAVAAGILALRNNPDHMSQLAGLGFEPIDLVAVNLYPFRRTMEKPGATEDEIIENIDIGGPSMLREAAKNFADVTVICDPDDYGRVLGEIGSEGSTTQATRKELAAKAFAHTAFYDAIIASWMARDQKGFPDIMTLPLERSGELRYGENPHQAAGWYSVPGHSPTGISDALQLNGKELSFNNIADADAAIEAVRLFGGETVCVNIKHANPCAIACADTVSQAFKKAWDADPVSIFGGIVAFSVPVDEPAAEMMASLFLEIVIAPDYTPGALEILCAKKNLRVLRLESVNDNAPSRRMKGVTGGLLIQESDDILHESFECPTKAKPTSEESEELLFALKCVKAIKSNAIAVTRNRTLIGVGPGQTNRIAAAKIALEYAGGRASGAVMASDAFFPFDDCVKAAAAAGITSIIQPGGAGADAESVSACDEAGISMVFCGTRHFRH